MRRLLTALAIVSTSCSPAFAQFGQTVVETDPLPAQPSDSMKHTIVVCYSSAVKANTIASLDHCIKGETVAINLVSCSTNGPECGAFGVLERDEAIKLIYNFKPRITEITSATCKPGRSGLNFEICTLTATTSQSGRNATVVLGRNSDGIDSVAIDAVSGEVSR